MNRVYVAPDYFRTTDLLLATALVSSNHQVVTIERLEPDTRATFIFEDTHALQNSMRAFWSGELTVDALQFGSTYKNLKNRAYNSVPME